MSVKETDKFKLSVIDEAYYLVEVKDDAEFDVADMQLLVETERGICNKKLPVLVLCAPTVNSSTEFLKYLSKNENNPLAVADAFVLSSVSQKILAHFYKMFIPHERPVSFFNSRENALKWLGQFME